MTRKRNGVGKIASRKQGFNKNTLHLPSLGFGLW